MSPRSIAHPEQWSRNVPAGTWGPKWVAPVSRGIYFARRADIFLASLVVLVAIAAIGERSSAADSSIAALAPPTTDDARRAVAIGPAGEVYEPDGNGAWIRKSRLTTADEISHVGRAGGAVIAFGEGIVYRLAPNGWSAIRLHQKEKAVMSGGAQVVAAVGRQIFVLDRNAGGEPAKLALAPSNVLAIGASSGTANPNVIVQTERGLFRVQGTKVTAQANAPRQITQLVSDRFALVDDGAIDLRTGRKTGWPPGTVVSTAAVSTDGKLVVVVAAHGKLELAVLVQDRFDRETIDVDAIPAPPVPASPPPASPAPASPAPASGWGTPASPISPAPSSISPAPSSISPAPSSISPAPSSISPAPSSTSPAPSPAPSSPISPAPSSSSSSAAVVAVGVAVDKTGRAVIALRDGRILIRTQPGSAWIATRVIDQLPAPKPGTPPALSR